MGAYVREIYATARELELPISTSGICTVHTPGAI